jgi:hypothetical protein
VLPRMAHGTPGMVESVVEGSTQTMARKSHPKKQFNWRVDESLISWTRDESDRLECSISDIVTQAVEYWRAHLEKEGEDDTWKT